MTNTPIGRSRPRPPCATTGCHGLLCPPSSHVNGRGLLRLPRGSVDGRGILRLPSGSVDHRALLEWCISWLASAATTAAWPPAADVWLQPEIYER